MNAKDFLDKHAKVIEGKCHNLGRVASLTVEFSNPRFYVNGCKWWGVVIYDDPEITRTECYNVFYGFVKYCGISVDDIYKWVMDNFAIMFKDHPYIYREEKLDTPE
jgi:hypothetical protein